MDKNTCTVIFTLDEEENLYEFINVEFEALKLRDDIDPEAKAKDLAFFESILFALQNAQPNL